MWWRIRWLIKDPLGFLRYRLGSWALALALRWLGEAVVRPPQPIKHVKEFVDLHGVKRRVEETSAIRSGHLRIPHFQGGEITRPLYRLIEIVARYEREEPPKLEAKETRHRDRSTQGQRGVGGEYGRGTG